jgi:hypothetical protein
MLAWIRGTGGGAPPLFLFPVKAMMAILFTMGDVRGVVLTLGDAKRQQGKIYTAERSAIPCQQLVSYC